MKSVEDIFRSLSLEQKTELLAGKNAWQTREEDGLPSVLMTDGPHGLRKLPNLNEASLDPSIPATCFPAAATLACSYDPALIREVGRAIGEEAREQNVQLVLGPGLNIKRSPLCGRNFEYYSEDPLLSGVCAAALAGGIQETGTGACLKHFAANNREYFRMTANSIIDERALHEIYLRGFEHAVKTSRPFAVMSAYNLLNNEYCGEKMSLIADTLRGSWGFDGMVVSDWGACCDRVAGVRAGLDLQMPYSGPRYAKQIRDAVASGELGMEDVDACVMRVLRFVERCEKGRQIPCTSDYPAHHDIARKAARESAVLLKNDDLLPLPENEKVALIGAFAVEPRYQGAGSSQIVPVDLENAYDAFPKYGLPFAYAPGYSLGLHEENAAKLREEAVALARKMRTAVILAGLPASQEYEGVDRADLDMPEDQVALIEAVAKVARTVVVLCCGAPVVMPWIAGVDAVLHCYLGGEAGASAAAELLVGRASPGGHLAESYPLQLEDTPAHRFFRDAKHNAEYRESTYVGYRFYQAARKDVLFPFGYGLSYTEFEWSGFDIAEKDGHVTASLTVRNTGSCAGSDLVQVYARGHGQPYSQLAGFSKVFLGPGESAHVIMILDRRSLQFYQDGWHDQNCEIFFAHNAADMVWGKHLPREDAELAPTYPLAPDGRWEPGPFLRLFGGKLPVFRVARPFTMNATPADLATTAIGRRIAEAMLDSAESALDHALPPVMKKLSRQTFEENPLRAIAAFSAGRLPPDLLSTILGVVNGNWLRELPRLLRELRQFRRSLGQELQ